MEEKISPEGAGDSLHALFLRCSNIISRRIGGNATRRRVIALLAERGELTQGELRKLLGLQAGSISELVTKMEGFGTVKREPDPKDKRRLVLRLTEEGKRRAAEPRVIGDEKLFAVLTPEEKDELRRILMKIEGEHERWRRENP